MVYLFFFSQILFVNDENCILQRETVSCISVFAIVADRNLFLPPRWEGLCTRSLSWPRLDFMKRDYPQNSTAAISLTIHKGSSPSVSEECLSTCDAAYVTCSFWTENEISERKTSKSCSLLWRKYSREEKLSAASPSQKKFQNFWSARTKTTNELRTTGAETTSMSDSCTGLSILIHKDTSRFELFETGLLVLYHVLILSYLTWEILTLFFPSFLPDIFKQIEIMWFDCWYLPLFASWKVMPSTFFPLARWHIFQS